MESHGMPHGIFPGSSQNRERPKVKLTVGRISTLRLPSGKTDHIEFDDEIPGFGLRLRESGSRTFVFQYNVGGPNRRKNLRAVSALNLAQAGKDAQNPFPPAKLG